MSLLLLVKKIPTDWKGLLLNQKEELEKISEFHDKQKETYEPHLQILPPDNLIFNCFNFFNISQTKIVILGQDPYQNIGLPMGLCFSVPNGTRTPPSLINIFKELESSYGKLRTQNDLSDLAKQGVLLLNTSLTVLEGKSNSFAKIWVKFTDKIIKDISDNTEKVVFILWGNNAIGKESLIDGKKHLILKSVHPSPLSASRGFFGNNHFRKANEYLRENGKNEILWI